MHYFQPITGQQTSQNLKTLMSLAVEGQNLVLKVSQILKCVWIIFQFHEEFVKKKFHQKNLAT